MLAELIDPTTLEEFVAGLARETGLRIAVYDDEALQIFATPPVTEYGRLLEEPGRRLPGTARGTATGETGTPDVRVVRGEGLARLLAPVVVSDETVGYIAVGEFADAPPARSRLEALARRAGVDERRLREAWRALPRLGPEDRHGPFRTARWLALTLGSWCQREFRARAYREELSLISGVTDLLMSDQPLQSVLDQIVVDTARVMRCRFCSIRLYDPETDELSIAAVHNLSRPYLAKGKVLRRQNPIDDAALRGEVVYVEDARKDARVRFRAEARRQGIVSGLSAGMIYGGRPVGVLRVYTDRVRRFRLVERNLLRAVAAQAASMILHRRFVQQRVHDAEVRRQLELARELQKRMIGRAPATLNGAHVALAFEPSFHVAGDLCDFFPLGGGWQALAVADVAGKGIPASLLAASVRSALRSSAPFCPDLGALLTRLNRHVVAETAPAEFVTAVLVALDAGARNLSLASAGHDPPLILRRGRVSVLGGGGTVLGVMPDETYRQRVIRLRPGDFILVYTDGAVDAMNFQGERFGRSRLRRALLRYADRDPRRTLRNILWDIRRFAGLADQTDDITLVGLRIPDAPG